VNTTFLSLDTKFATFTLLASKCGGQLLNEMFIYLKDITSSPGYLKGWRIFKMAVVTLGPKRHLRITLIVTLIASRSDQLTEIYFSSNLNYSFLDDDDNCD